MVDAEDHALDWDSAWEPETKQATKVTQNRLFNRTTHDLLVAAEVLYRDALKWWGLGWLSFAPNPAAEISYPESCEILFVRNVLRCDPTGSIVEWLKKDYELPLAFEPFATAFQCGRLVEPSVESNLAARFARIALRISEKAERIRTIRHLRGAKFFDDTEAALSIVNDRSTSIVLNSSEVSPSGYHDDLYFDPPKPRVDGWPSWKSPELSDQSAIESDFRHVRWLSPIRDDAPGWMSLGKDANLGSLLSLKPQHVRKWVKLRLTDADPRVLGLKSYPTCVFQELLFLRDWLWSSKIRQEILVKMIDRLPKPHCFNNAAAYHFTHGWVTHPDWIGDVDLVRLYGRAFASAIKPSRDQIVSISSAGESVEDCLY